MWSGGQRSAKGCQDATGGRDVAPGGRSSYTAALGGFTWWEKRNRRKREGISQKVYLKDFLKRRPKPREPLMGKVLDVDEGKGKGDNSLASVIRVNKWMNKMLKATELGDSFRA